MSIGSGIGKSLWVKTEWKYRLNNSALLASVSAEVESACTCGGRTCDLVKFLIKRNILGSLLVASYELDSVHMKTWQQC